MRDYTSFIKAALKKITVTGAVWPSSRSLVKLMMQNIDFDNDLVIVELGPGTGPFTAELIKRKTVASKLLLVEKNPDFVSILKEKFPELIIILGGAEDLGKYMLEHDITDIDYCISGLPFGIFPESLSKQILRMVKKYLKPNGRLIAFQYSTIKEKLFKKFFKLTRKRFTFLNIPPAYVFEMKS